MSRRSKKTNSNRRAKASKSNLAVVVLIVIIVVQAFLLLKAYNPKKQNIVSKKPRVIAPKVRHQATTPTPQPDQGQTVAPHNLYPPGKIVLIIDDSGYNRSDCSRLAEIDVPVTISILPDLPHSRDVAECANAQGKEVMLHLPLEPHVIREQYPKNYFIRTNMSSSQITNRLNEALKSVPHIAGINNHEGSKATEDSRVMYLIFKELSKKKLFFVDSRVTSKSVCQSLAEKLRLPFAGRDVFLDNENNRQYIEGQFRDLEKKSSLRGTAVAIGHARELSWDVMIEQTKNLHSQGYQFITVQEMIDSKK